MAAPNLPTLYQFETAFEDAAVTFLETAVGIECFPSASQDDFVTPRLAIEFTTGQAEMPIDAPISSTPALALGEYRKHTAEFNVAIVTDSSQGQTRAQHFGYVGKTRAALLRSQTNWNASTLPYYDLKFIRQSGTIRETDGDFQITAISYEIRFSIRDDAFPVSTTTTTPAP